MIFSSVTSLRSHNSKVHKRAALQSELKLLEAQGVRSSSMKNVAMRILSGWFGLNLASIAILGPLLFIANEMQEMESAKQYHGQVSITGAVGGCVLMFGVSALSGIASLLTGCYGAR